MSHTDDGTLHAYLDGELSTREAVELEQHVAGCSDCRARLEEARALIKRAGSLLALAAPSARAAPPWPPATAALGRWRRHGVPLAWAATVVLALGTAWYVGRRALPVDRAAPAPPTAALRRAEPLAATPPPAPPPVASPQAAPSSAAAAVPGPASGRPRADSAVAPVLVAERAAESRIDLSPWVELGFDGAGTLLGQPPLAIPGLSIRRLARPRTGEALVLVEQLVDSGTVVRLYEQRRPAPGADSLRQRELVAGAAPARLARDAGPLRVEIEGPLLPDSLRRLLERVR